MSLPYLWTFAEPKTAYHEIAEQKTRVYGLQKSYLENQYRGKD